MRTTLRWAGSSGVGCPPALRWIGSDGDTGLAWGGVGVLHWLIRADDLAVGRFDRVRCVMQSG
ncbi:MULTISPECIES: DUF1963 domain-containing protein [Actinomycetes]|uniref:DUF1963 domain-containing protein n=1 Tax=Actinomycetes TaxID=1760 RepID=UPI0001DEE73A|nr:MULTISPECIES: DUF1963 domain-containing protein [Actinomycetes]EFL08784.1 predicted protein [Streptomyces sp. AA4]